MGIGFVFFFWIIFFLIIAGTYLVLKHFAKRTFLKNSFKSTILLFFSFAVIVVGLFILTSFTDRFCSTCVFYSSFKFYPTDIRNLDGYKTSFGDAGSSNLSFQTEKNIIEKIIKERKFTEINKGLHQKFDSQEIEELLLKTTSKIYYSPTFNNEFGKSRATLVYDEESKQAYFNWSGVD